jgi:hypothetical protein
MGPTNAGNPPVAASGRPAGSYQPRPLSQCGACRRIRPPCVRRRRHRLRARTTGGCSRAPLSPARSTPSELVPPATLRVRQRHSTPSHPQYDRNWAPTEAAGRSIQVSLSVTERFRACTATVSHARFDVAICGSSRVGVVRWSGCYDPTSWFDGVTRRPRPHRSGPSSRVRPLQPCPNAGR